MDEWKLLFEQAREIGITPEEIRKWIEEMAKQKEPTVMDS